MSNNSDSDPDSELTGIPNIGPARRATLIAAGITTRAALARSTVEQLVSVTGMARSLAQKTLDALKDDPAAAVGTASPPLTDEALPDDAGMTEAPPVSEADAPEPEPPVTLDIALFKLTTALSDASRILGNASGLTRPLTRLAGIIERIPRRAAQISAKRQARLADKLNDLTVRLEKAATNADSMTSVRIERLRDRLKTERREIAQMLDGKLRRKAR